jgi:four helix bundle protein
MADLAKSSGPRYRSFRELTVWQEAMDLAVTVHGAARALPVHERYGLGQELRKTCRSIPSNVAEGFNRHSRAAYRLHIAIALGSQAELETQVELARRLEYLSELDTTRLLSSIAAVGQLLQGLWRALE